MKSLFKSLGLACAIGVAVLCLGNGCESDEDESADDTALPTLVSTNDLQISPASVTLSAGLVTNVEFAAFGGTSNYTWSVNDATLGSVATVSNASAIYTSTTNSGVNFVIVTDSDSNAVAATVTQL
jgi:hypothetical protein